MAASTMSSADTFGHFRLPLTMNKGHIDPRLAEGVIKMKNRYLERFSGGRPQRHACRNLLGMLSFRLGRYEQALEYLDKVLSPTEDQDNLNALANRKYICEKLYRYKEARDCEQRIVTLLTEDDTKDGEKKRRQLRARSIAEQAYAFTNEINEETTTCERHRRSFDMYQKAIELAGEDIEKGERVDWDFQSGCACQTIYLMMKFDKSKRGEVKTFLQNAVNTFIKIAKSSEENMWKSDALYHLGKLFRQSKDLLPPIPEPFDTFVHQPEKCFEEAMLLCPDAPYIPAGYARNCRENKSKALSLAERSIQLDSTDFNCYGRWVRASILINQYKQELKEFRTSCSTHRPDESLLEQAEGDLSIALHDVSKPWYLEDMAEVFYYKAKDANGRVKQGNAGRENLQQALTYCAKAVETADGTKRPGTHKVRGICLCASGEHEAALACYKRAVDCELAKCYHKGSIGLLVTEYEHVIKPILSSLSGNTPLLADMVYWFDRAAEGCLSTDWTLRQVRDIKQLPGFWDTFVKYCNKNGHTTKLKSIELAATDRRQPPAALQHFIPAPVERSLAAKRQDQSLRAATKADEKFSWAGWDQTRRQPHAIRQLSLPTSGGELNHPASAHMRQQSVPAASANYSEERFDVENVAESRSAVQLADNASESDTVQITYSINVRTGKIVQIPTISSAEHIHTEVIQNKHIKPAPKESFNRQLEYDFVVIYSNSASEWVQHCMLPVLEETSGLRGCIKDRDFGLGKSTLIDYVENTEKTSCTIIVITNDFEKDAICSHAMLQAVQHGRLVIPVLREARDMPILLRPYTSLDATGAVDWARLVRSIEQGIKLDDVTYET